MRKIVAFWILAAPLLVGAAASSCKSMPQDSSAFARASGESTVAVGSTCFKPLEKGFSSCQLQSGKPLPELFLAFLNDAEYAVSDCDLNIWKTGTAKKGQLVTIDLALISSQVENNGFCLLKIETIEHFPDNRDPTQIRSVSMSGGFFIELLDADYFPQPPKDMIAFCTEFKIERTTKGRTQVTSKDCL